MNRDFAEKTGNKYILLDRIGIGGMAEVYRCKLIRQKGFEKVIVLKKLLPHVAQDKEIVENFIDEARLAALLQHENIISIYDFGELDGSYFIAMEYLFGKDLHTIMQRTKEINVPMEAGRALRIAAKICAGMEYAHSLKDLKNSPLHLIHRDLSPHNVFITYDGKVKIIDFGIAKAELYDNHTQVGVLKGKISYMSPEQLAGENIDLRSDIFSIGILLYEMLSGQRMYKGDTATLIRKCMLVEYVEPEKTCPGLQKEIYDILHKALQKDKTKRYQSCGSMRSDIDDCLFNMKQRVDDRSLQDYVRQVFAVEFEVEKNRLPEAKEHLAEHTVSPADKTAYSDVSKYPELNTVAKRHDDSQADLSSFWKKTVAGAMVFVIVLFFFQYAGVKNEKVDEIIPVIVEKQVPAVELSPVKLPSVEKVVEVEKEVETVPPVVSLSPRQLQVEEFLTKAQKSFADNRLVQPVHDSALGYYQKVLEVDPENRVAIEGISSIGQRYAELAEQALWEDKYIEAEKFTSMGLRLFPRDKWLLSLQRKIEKQKNFTQRKLGRLPKRSE